VSTGTEVWVCKSCGVARNAENSRLLLILGWELLSLRRVDDRRQALCPRCNGERLAAT
jgi:hypothetical protein